MDDLDHKILQLLAENARMPVKDIAQRVSLTSPAVSSRIHRLEQEGVGNVDVVIECVGKPVTIEQAIQIAGHKATVMMFGLTKPDETITVKPFEVFQKELVLTSSYINPYTQRRALELIDSGRLDVSSMVAKVASLDELGAILSDPALRAMGKYIIDPSK